MPTNALNTAARDGYSGDTPLGVLVSYGYASEKAQPADPQQVEQQLQEHAVRREALAHSRRRCSASFGIPSVPSF